MAELAMNESAEEDSRKRKAEDISSEVLEEKRQDGAATDPPAAEQKEDLPTQEETTETDVKANDEASQDTSVTKQDTPDAVEEKEEPMEVETVAPVPAVAAHTNEEPSAAPAAASTTESTKTNPYDLLKWTVVRNDGKPDSMIKLVGLKSLFSKQLPKMPRAYIARLVFDRRHTSLAILNDSPAVKDSDEEIIGGICYRAFPEMRFAEIAFCAVNASHQVKGYGTRLMNLLKKIGAETGIEYFITYADNYAIGYFKKQGFTKSISMPKGRYFGLIKDYDGGTPMECYLHPSIDFTRIPEMLEAQRKFILERIQLVSNSQTVYDPLPKEFKPDLEGVSRQNLAAARAMAIPGIVEAGWTMADLIAATGQGKEVDRQKSALKSELLAMVRKIEEQQFAWPFREPVDPNEVADYLDVIKEPIDLSTIEKRIRQDNHYKSKQMLFADLMLMVNNCLLYNEEASLYSQCARQLERFLGGLFHDLTATRV